MFGYDELEVAREPFPEQASREAPAVTDAEDARGKDVGVEDNPYQGVAAAGC